MPFIHEYASVAVRNTLLDTTTAATTVVVAIEDGAASGYSSAGGYWWSRKSNRSAAPVSGQITEYLEPEVGMQIVAIIAFVTIVISRIIVVTIYYGAHNINIRLWEVGLYIWSIYWQFR